MMKTKTKLKLKNMSKRKSHWGESIVTRKAVGGPRRVKHLNFILEIAHFSANVICVRKISRVPKSEGER